ncbi:MAG: DUF1127 domain-containing protein [Rhodobacteraceae bacterium]|nr:DUF1127 domain-containing protein [Paracoccaceae bacterium]
MSANTLSHARRLPQASARTGRGGSTGFLGILERWARLAYERRALSQADDSVLRDIGVNRAQANYEASRPFWDVPDGR